MRKETRFKFNQYLSRLAELNDIELSSVSTKFSVEPSVTQTLYQKVQESSSFLKLINMVPVAELTEQKVGVGVNGSIASTSDTDNNVKRKTADFTGLESYKYFCAQINFDYHLKYNKLDLWARFEAFQTLIRDAIVLRTALDYITIGFNGVKRSPTSDRAQYPLLQDVAVGWLQKYRNEAPERVMSEVTDAEGNVISAKIKVGKGGHYANLDALVMDAHESLIDELYREDPELVVICGRKIMTDKYFPMVNKFQPNSEQLAAELIISQKTIGNLQAVRAPFFPANAIFITTLSNLSIYYKDDSHRRFIKDNPELDQVDNFESIKADFVIEQYAAGCLVENIEVLETVEDETQTPAQVASDFAKALTDAVKEIAAGAPASKSAQAQDVDKHTEAVKEVAADAPVSKSAPAQDADKHTDGEGA